jgi:lysyl-tRNA synthetase class 2
MKPEKKAVTPTDGAKAVFALLKKSSTIELNTLLERAGLSNKK